MTTPFKNTRDKIQKPELENTLNAYVDTALLIATVALWPTAVFNIDETTIIKNKIRQCIKSSPNHYEGYIACAQRFLLAKESLVKFIGKAYISHPFRWMIKDGELGFDGTEKLLSGLNTLRRTTPLYKLQNMALAEAVVNIREEYTYSNFLYWTTWFRQRNYHVQAFIFHACIFKTIFSTPNN
ncbi:MAG: hypothetical protein JWP81_2463 [Ferruginibacter sp.]|nr:hypothetical protein [Ferruginibacter sp.]